METLVVTPQHRNQYYSRDSSRVHSKFGSPTGGFRDITCKFQARDGILSTPLKSRYFPPLTNNTPSPKKQAPISSRTEGDKFLKCNQRSTPVPISSKASNQKSNPIPINSKPGNLQKSFSDDLSNSELWAGPTYSNSPPPSSLPIPKFSLRQKSVSLELPEKEFGLKFHPVAKSAPSSPRGGSCPSPPNSFFHSTALATKDLRRILNLDIDDE